MVVIGGASEDGSGVEVEIIVCRGPAGVDGFGVVGADMLSIEAQPSSLNGPGGGGPCEICAI